MQGRRLYGIRGAVCAKNTAESIASAVDALASALVLQNKLTADMIVSIQFTVTSDLTALNPASALRKSSLALLASHTALFCAAEPKIAGALSHTIRILVTAYLPEAATPSHAYIGGAQVLRPDLAR